MPPSPDEPSAFEQIRDTPGLRLFIRTARAWGVRPSEFLEWDDEDRAYALALTEYEDDACPGCGGQLAVTTDPAAEARFLPGPPIRCHRCTAMSQAAAVHNTTYHPHAVLHTVRDRALEPDPPDATGGADDEHAEKDNRPAETGEPVEGE